jgi:hypothetical protein
MKNRKHIICSEMNLKVTIWGHEGHLGAVLTQEGGSQLPKCTSKDTFTFLCFPIIKFVYQMI